MPQGIHVSKTMEISCVVPELVSLHEWLYEPPKINQSEQGLSLFKKMSVLIELAKVLSQFHSLGNSPIAHGSITSHNIFIDLSSDGSNSVAVKIGELEMNDFKRYANMFYSYRSVTVWSPPECLK